MDWGEAKRVCFLNGCFQSKPPLITNKGNSLIPARLPQSRLEQTSVEEAKRSTRRGVTVGQALGRGIELASQHLHLVDKPVHPVIDRSRHNSRTDGRPLSADDASHARAAGKDEEDDSPRFVLRVNEPTNAYTANVRVIPGRGYSLSGNRESKEEQTDDADRLEDNLNDGKNSNAMGKAKHLLHVLRDPITQWMNTNATREAAPREKCRAAGDTPAGVGDTPVAAEDKPAGDQHSRAAAGDKPAAAGDSQAERRPAEDSWQMETKMNCCSLATHHHDNNRGYRV